MDKIKINLVSGTSLEKPLITAFKGNEGDYVILDNEINGSMGLPIILVSKLSGTSLVKIVDKSPEWEAVKESLRLIIAGSQIDYITVPQELSADDTFFTQLTLPAASFEALKNNYKPNEVATPLEAQSVAEVTPVTPVETAPAPEQPVAVEQTVAPAPQEVVQPTPQPEQPSPVEAPVSPNNLNADVVVPQAPQSAPAPVTQEVIAPAPQEVVTPAAPVAAQTVAEVAETPAPDVPIDFTADRDAFLQACGNMFDALVAKFKNQ